MQHLRMELNGIEALFRILSRSHRAVVRMSDDSKARSGLRDLIKMAHPADRVLWDILKQLSRTVHIQLSLAIFSYGSLFHPAPKDMHHELCAVTESKHRYSYLKQLLSTSGSPGLIAAVRPSRKDDALRLHLLYLCNVRSVGIYLAIDIAFSYTPRDQLVILASEINYNDLFLHRVSLNPPGMLRFVVYCFMIFSRR